MTMLASARWGHRCEDAWLSPRSPWGHACRVVELCPQERVALAVEVTSPCPGLQQNSSRVPPTSSAAGISFFYFTVNLSFFFFFFFLLKPKTGWRLASRAGTSLPGTSAIPRGCGAGAGPTDASLAWWGQGRGAQGRAWGGTWTPGTGPRAFIWHQQTPTRQFPPTRVGKWEREERGPALPRPPADAGRTSSLCPHSRDRLKPREASPPPRRQQHQELG